MSEHEIEFLDGFATGAEISRSEAGETWSAFSRQLSTGAITHIEQGGYDAGFEEGVRFLKHYTDERRLEQEAADDEWRKMF